ncbi:MAG: UDP-N-acetylmuramate--L-alanine ligase, partial [Alistipes sp.]|nr:UDP-N-acetylmuramate--L-alanine ligase [Alistipes sp.]
MKTAYYFLGIGGIGMSALARYFLHMGCRVAGYDRTPTRLTDALQEEGAEIHFEEGVELIPE